MHNYIKLRPKASWTGLICCNRQQYHRHRLSNT